MTTVNQQPSHLASSMSDDLQKLIKKRNLYKGSIDTIVNYVNKFNPATHTVRQLRTRLNKLDALLTNIENVQESIMDLNQGHEDEAEFHKFDDEICTLRADLEDLIEKHSIIEKSHNDSSSCHSEAVRLPAITPPTFSGNLEDWASFIDTFDALFHNNALLSDVQRLHYLKLSVTGEAANVLRNYKITAENYQVAYQELTNQYENKGLTIQTHIRALLQSPKVYQASAVELRNLHHHVSSHVRALQSLGQPVQQWDAWLVTIICVQLDPTTAGEWQLQQKSKDLPTYEEIESFLAKRVAAYEAGDISSSSVSAKRKNNANNKILFTQNIDSQVPKCPVCSSVHKLYSCDKFKKMNVSDRKNVAFNAKLCFNCLNAKHQARLCKYPSCAKCGERHNIRLHEERPTRERSNENVLAAEREAVVIFTNTPNDNMNVMLATTLINVYDEHGNPHTCRAVLDSGSQLNFITRDCANRLGLKCLKNNLNIAGVAAMTSAAHATCQTVIASRFGKHRYTLQLNSLPVIVNVLPIQSVSCNFTIPKHVHDCLADPQFHQPGAIDILLGAEVFFDALGSEKWSLSEDAALHQSKFGWFVSGRLPFTSSINATSYLTTGSKSALSLFSSKASCQTAEERQAEEHFTATTSQTAQGKFVVRLPLAQNPKVLGDSLRMAQKRFYNLEKRLIKDPVLAEYYGAFMNEYLSMGHMELAQSNHKGPTFYLPHHAIFKAGSSTTKIRVVFDGSASTSSGLSLNDILLKGPKVQPDILHILWRFRIHQIAITADVAKMYRQVLIDPADRDLQRICYREKPDEPLKIYKLNTVTYGTKSASFLATRCLVRVAENINDKFLKGVIAHDFYVDDLISGGSSEDQCYDLYQKLQSTLGNVGFPLRKWCSSSSAIMKRIPDAEEDANYMVKINEEDVVSALGLLWQPSTDSFCFIMKDWTPPKHLTKRSLLSDMNSVYDPLGLISPVLVRGKIFIQQLWCLKVAWDDELPDDLQLRWKHFYSGLKLLSHVRIPRCIISSVHARVELHGFSDASQQAFGSCLYIRSISPDNKIDINLYTSKSRVAPIRLTTIPRLELCGALLLAELVTDVQNELRLLNMIIPTSHTFLWTDSSIVISWINSQQLLKTYVANRVAQVLELTERQQWRHVSTHHNPADLVSRGVSVDLLAQNNLWWKGPEWLANEECTWPSSPITIADVPEIRTIKIALTSIHDLNNPLLEAHSSWLPLIRTTAWILRFTHNSKTPAVRNELRLKGHLTVKELQAARMLWFRFSQRSNFSQELHDLQAERQVARKSCLRSLNPFVDSDGIIRVGGRLITTSLPHTTRYPIVIHSKHKITRLLFQYEHLRLLHAGPQVLLAQMHRICWPIRGKVLARTVVRNCVVCHRFNPSLQTPLMAPLPRERVTIERPFFRSGVDFCSPIYIKSGLRRVTSIKCYIAVFVCFVTRAVHLELVTDMTSNAFLAALTRFMSRSGTCSHIHSDNGTNFVGASKTLKSYLQTNNSSQPLVDTLANHGVQWHFNPPSAPHFGGLWEAAVKSAKHHLLRTTKGALLTFEEMNTLLCRVEAILNSRPLTSLSSDPNDHEALTPNHFLIGGVSVLPHEPDVPAVHINRLRRFELMKSQLQRFWKRWSLDYLPQLQRRGRWTTISRNIKVGDLAILREESVPSFQWKLVRVVDVHPGGDNVVRVVTVKLSSGAQLKRPVTKLSVLPNPEECDEEDTVGYPNPSQ